MATTFGFQLATSPNTKGLYPVILRITQDRRQKKIRTTFEVKKADWNQKAKNYKHFRVSYPDYAKANFALQDLIREYEEKYTPDRNAIMLEAIYKKAMSNTVRI